MIMLEFEQTSAVHFDTYGFKQTLTIFNINCLHYKENKKSGDSYILIE